MAVTAEILTALVDAARRRRVPLITMLGALLVVVLAGLAIPVGLPDRATAEGRGQDPTGPVVEVAAAEDLGAFLDSRRWGVALRDIIDEAAAAAAAAAREAEEIEITAELAKIGFVGLMVEPDEYAVLLVLPDGKLSRLAGGDALPDGRTLVSVTGNSLTLEDSDRHRDVLPLFPRIRTE